MAFKDCSEFTGELIIPDSVTSIGEAAFEDCSGFIGRLIIPDSVLSIGSHAFSGCSNLTEVKLGSKLTIIERNTFSSCDKLVSIILPVTVRSIGMQAFDGCEMLTTVNYTGTQEQWLQINIESHNESLINASKVYNYKIS